MPETRRKVTIRFHEEFDGENVPAGTRPEPSPKDHPEFRKNMLIAVGYLSTWAIHNVRYAECHVYGDGDGNLHATYRNADGQVTYQLFGQLGDDGAYSFHS